MRNLLLDVPWTHQIECIQNESHYLPLVLQLRLDVLNSWRTPSFTPWIKPETLKSKDF